MGELGPHGTSPGGWFPTRGRSCSARRMRGCAPGLRGASVTWMSEAAAGICLLKCFCRCFCWTFRAKPEPRIPWVGAEIGPRPHRPPPAGPPQGVGSEMGLQGWPGRPPTRWPSPLPGRGKPHPWSMATSLGRDRLGRTGSAGGAPVHGTGQAAHVHMHLHGHTPYSHVTPHTLAARVQHIGHSTAASPQVYCTHTARVPGTHVQRTRTCTHKLRCIPRGTCDTHARTH